MALFTVHKGKHYRATIRLGFFQGLASNQQVADRFTQVGFTDVNVTGSGRDRVATGLWSRPDATAQVPDEITSVEVIEV